MVQTFGAISIEFRYEPDDVNTMVTHVEAFGDPVSDAAALFIVSFCKEKNGWVLFSQTEMDVFASKHGGATAFDFGGLVDNGFITKFDDLYQASPAFVDMCYEKSPSTTGPASRAARARDSAP